MGATMKKLYVLAITVCALVGMPTLLKASRAEVTAEQMQLVKEIQHKLNYSFQCDFSIFIAQTRKYATANSSGVILIDKSFLQSADRGSLFFAIAHEYAHAYLQHDIRMYGHAQQRLRKMSDVRRAFEKEADGIAARKAKQMGFAIEGITTFILTSPDAEKGIPAEHRVYSRPRERADYILAVYQSS
jgi:Zn-dependent protease with chaperone function